MLASRTSAIARLEPSLGGVLRFAQDFGARLRRRANASISLRMTNKPRINADERG